MMKYFFAFLTLIFLNNSINAQAEVWWFDAGVKAGYGAAGLLNSNVSDSKLYNNDIGSTYSYGAKVSVNFDNHGFTLDGMLGNGKQVWEYVPEGGTTTNFDLKWQSIDIYALYRNNRNITYFEVGPKLSLLQSAEQSNELTGEYSDVKSSYNANEISAVAGFGWYALGGGSFSGILGFRLEYGITDFVGDAGAKLGAPIFSAENLDPYAKSNRLSASVVFEANWGIGYFGRAACGARSKFISFD